MYQVRVALLQNIYCFYVLVDFSDLNKGSPIRRNRMEPNLENEGAKRCYQIVKSNDLESTRLTMPSFLLLYGLWLHSIVYLTGLGFNCVFKRTGCCSEIDFEITLHFCYWHCTCVNLQNSYFFFFAVAKHDEKLEFEMKQKVLF